MRADSPSGDGFLGTTWRVVEVVIGVALLALGGVATMTGLLAYIGLPMMALGLIILLRAWSGSQAAAR